MTSDKVSPITDYKNNPQELKLIGVNILLQLTKKRWNVFA